MFNEFKNYTDVLLLYCAWKIKMEVTVNQLNNMSTQHAYRQYTAM